MSITANIEAEPLVDEDSGEDWLRVAINTSKLRPEDLPKIGTAYKDTSLQTTNGRMDLFQDYVLRKYVNGPPSIRFAHFLKPKTDEEANTPYKTEENSKTFVWPIVAHAWVLETDSTFTITRTRANGTTVKTPTQRGRIVYTPETFALCKTVTDYFISDRPFKIPNHIQLVTGRIEWIVDGKSKTLDCLHPEFILPAGDAVFNPIEIQGDTSSLDVTLGNRRRFPATPLKDWKSIVIADDPVELESGHYQRRRTRIFPPKRPKLASL
jgi:hypothetical protein